MARRCVAITIKLDISSCRGQTWLEPLFFVMLADSLLMESNQPSKKITAWCFLGTSTQEWLFKSDHDLQEFWIPWYSTLLWGSIDWNHLASNKLRRILTGWFFSTNPRMTFQVWPWFARVLTLLFQKITLPPCIKISKFFRRYNMLAVQSSTPLQSTSIKLFGILSEESSYIRQNKMKPLSFLTWNSLERPYIIPYLGTTQETYYMIFTFGLEVWATNRDWRQESRNCKLQIKPFPILLGETWSQIFWRYLRFYLHYLSYTTRQSQGTYSPQRQIF